MMKGLRLWARVVDTSCSPHVGNSKVWDARLFAVPLVLVIHESQKPARNKCAIHIALFVFGATGLPRMH